MNGKFLYSTRSSAVMTLEAGEVGRGWEAQREEIYEYLYG